MIIVVTFVSHPYNIRRIKVVQGLCNSARNICFLLKVTIQSIVFVVDLLLTLPSKWHSLNKKYASNLFQ